MAFPRFSLLLALARLQLAVAEQPSAPAPVAAPLRQLPWGQLNFLHTTDTHGWFAGHLSEPQYSADWGDYISFAHHLRQRAEQDGSDLLLIDTGDRVEGNGLYDASDPKGEYTLDIIKEQHIDVITTGNHELYQTNTSIREYQGTVRDFKGSYIASNLDIYDPNGGKDAKLVPLAPRFRKFTTKNQGIRVIAFGFLFDFQGNSNNTVVQPVEETIKEQWFKDAIADNDVDLFLVAGHVPVRDSKEFDAVYKAIRAEQWDTPIVFFGGHTHIRDYRKWDKRAYGLESGRYMETLGFLSVSGLSGGGKGSDKAHASKSPDYRRLYIDNNLHSLYHHSNTTKSAFHTEHGSNVSSAIHAARKDLKLDHTFGCAPKTYWLNRAPFPSNDSILTLLEQRVLPDTFGGANASCTIVVTNSGALRFDLFKGPFTIDSTFLISPFTSGFSKIKDVPYAAASQVLRLLNNEGPVPLTDMLALAGQPSWGRNKLHELVPPLSPVNKLASTQGTPDVEVSNTAARLGEQIPLQPSDIQKDKSDDGKGSDEPSLPGYTTTDDAGSDGDDTIHAPIKFYTVPNCVGVDIGFDSAAASPPDTVDLVYNEFIEDWVLLALRFAGVRYGRENAAPALHGKTLTTIISDWVAANWACEE